MQDGLEMVETRVRKINWAPLQLSLAWIGVAVMEKERKAEAERRFKGRNDRMQWQIEH